MDGYDPESLPAAWSDYLTDANEFTAQRLGIILITTSRRMRSIENDVESAERASRLAIDVLSAVCPRGMPEIEVPLSIAYLQTGQNSRCIRILRRHATSAEYAYLLLCQVYVKVGRRRSAEKLICRHFDLPNVSDAARSTACKVLRTTPDELNAALALARFKED